MFKLPKRGRYVGRLAFDPDTGFHVGDDGRSVVTVDGGKSWSYAKRGDASHQARYHRRHVVIDSTANAENPESHHWAVQPGDAHHGGVLADSDIYAPLVTSHTDAWKEPL